MKICDDALADAKKRHPHFPGNLSAMVTILNEEWLEATVAMMRVNQAINDCRDDGKPLANVVTELTHTHAVITRMLEKLIYEQRRD